MEEPMSKLRYFIQKHITISEFAKVLAIPSLDVELDDSPTNFYPYFRLTLGNTTMVARTNVHGHVVQLIPISADSDGHRKIADIIAELFDTEIEVEDFSKWGSAIPCAPKFEVSEKAGGFR
jgi:hypothetical protein